MNQELISRLNRHISARSLLDHPFYQAWKAGELTKDDLRVYAGQYYHFEANFPRYLSAVHARCPNAAVRQDILRNLWDEEHGDQNHRALWLGFCDGLGMSSDDAQLAPVQPRTQALLDAYSDICSNRSFQEGLAAIYAYEAQVPDVMAEKLAGLRDRYSIADDTSLAFFRIHESLDVEHSRLEADAISEHTTKGEEPLVEAALVAGLEAWWGFLDGVNELRAGTEIGAT